MSFKDQIECPTCHKKNTWTPENIFRPFCCERCKLIDLGEWADEQHRIPGESANADSLNDHSSDEKNSE